MLQIWFLRSKKSSQTFRNLICDWKILTLAFFQNISPVLQKKEKEMTTQMISLIEIWRMPFLKKKKKIIAAVSNSRINIGDWSILKYFVESIFAIDKVWKTFQKKFLQIRVNIVKKDSGNFPSTKHLFL